MFGFLIAVAAGFFVPMLENTLTKPVIAILRRAVQIAEDERRAITIMLAMLVTAIAATVFDSGSVLGLSIGFILGYFGVRIFDALKAQLS